MNCKKVYAMLVLLLMGSASFAAQTDDPFGDVDFRYYSNNMSLTAYVRMNDQVLGKDIVVAAYCGQVLRGKNSPRDDNSYTNILYLEIYGDTKGEKLHFKVFIPGDGQTSEDRVIEVDQGLTYTSDDIVGEAERPYYIDLSTPVTTTFSIEGWATTCLPYDAKVPDGVTLYNATGIENSELVMETLQPPIIHSPLGKGEEIMILPKDTPVLLQGEGSTSCEWLPRVITQSTADTQETTATILKGTTEPTEVTPSTVLTLGHSKETGDIGFWLYTGSTIPANRAYIADFPGGTNGARIVTDFGGTTAIGEMDNEAERSQSSIFNPQSSIIYDLQGRPIELSVFNSQSSILRKGVYVVNGKKMAY